LTERNNSDGTPHDSRRRASARMPRGRCTTSPFGEHGQTVAAREDRESFIARLDAPGTLHHVMVRVVERRAIFRDNVIARSSRPARTRRRPGNGTGSWANLERRRRLQRPLLFCHLWRHDCPHRHRRDARVLPDVCREWHPIPWADRHTSRALACLQCPPGRSPRPAAP